MNRTQPRWKHYRVIHSKYPPIDVFESPDHLILGELESATSDRVVNWPRYVLEEDYRAGEGWGAVMASFCYPAEGRFNTASRGAYYAGDCLETALREWAHHTGKVWQGFGVGNDFSAVVRCYTGHVTKLLVDVRGQPEYRRATDYQPGQQLAAELLSAGEYGILYSSVRSPGAEAVALLRPPATTPVTQAGHYVLAWNGQQFTQYAHIDAYHAL